MSAYYETGSDNLIKINVNKVYKVEVGMDLKQDLAWSCVGCKQSLHVNFVYK
jgi:hypothetical protein